MHEGLWTDLLIACVVLLVVLAPAGFFRGDARPLIGRDAARSRRPLAQKQHRL